MCPIEVSICLRDFGVFRSFSRGFQYNIYKGEVLPACGGLQGGGAAGVWGVISFKEFLRCMLYLLYKIDVEYLFEINI